jgi:hypothetical protein
MKVKRIYLLALLLAAASYGYAYAGQSGGTITFSGQIINSVPTSQSTVITPTTQSTNTTASATPTSTTTYTVTSAVTGRTLATFDNQAAATAFVKQLNPVVPYEQ